VETCRHFSMLLMDGDSLGKGCRTPSSCSACMDASCLHETSDPGLFAALLPDFRRLWVAGKDTICVLPGSLGYKSLLMTVRCGKSECVGVTLGGHKVDILSNYKHRRPHHLLRHTYSEREPPCLCRSKDSAADMRVMDQSMSNYGSLEYGNASPEVQRSLHALSFLIYMVRCSLTFLQDSPLSQARSTSTKNSTWLRTSTPTNSSNTTIHSTPLYQTSNSPALRNKATHKPRNRPIQDSLSPNMACNSMPIRLRCNHTINRAYPVLNGRPLPTAPPLLRPRLRPRSLRSRVRPASRSMAPRTPPLISRR
jgi:hypothetical protein